LTIARTSSAPTSGTSEPASTRRRWVSTARRRGRRISDSGWAAGRRRTTTAPSGAVRTAA